MKSLGEKTYEGFIHRAFCRRRSTFLGNLRHVDTAKEAWADVIVGLSAGSPRKEIVEEIFYRHRANEEGSGFFPEVVLNNISGIAFVSVAMGARHLPA